MRPVIEIRATLMHSKQVCIQASNSLWYFGGLTMPVKEYRAFLSTLLTGSLAMGRKGCEIKLVEEGFEQCTTKKEGVCV